jgi:hypothetical protein
MKRSVFIIAFLAVSFMAMAQQWTRVISDTPETYRIQLVSSSEKSIKVNVQVPGFYTKDVITPRGEAKIVTLPKAVSTAQAGEPNLPMTGIPAIIGDQARMDIRVLDAQYTDFEGIEVAPSKGDFSRQIDPATVPYTYGNCYNQDAFFPSNNVGLYEPYIIRDFRGQNMVVYPFAYNPVTKTLRVYYNMTVEMYKVDDNGSNVMETRRSNTIKLAPDFKSMYQRHFINYEAALHRYTPVDEEGDLLIICYDSFINSMTDFVNWKKTRGINTTIVGVSTAGSTYSAIKSYIQSQYNANNNLTHVLLVGDVDQIPGYTFSGSYKGDNPYGEIVGNDTYNDVFIGRFSASTATHVATQVQKVITYERDLTTSATWLSKGLGVSTTAGNSGHYSEDDYQHIDNIRTDLMNYGYSTVYQEYYNVSGYSSTTQQISTRINSGVGIINYCNHGSQTAWQSHSPYYSNSYVNALTNDNMLPFIFSVACLNGQYDYNSDCFAEAWMRATNNNQPAGAIGGMFSYISQPWIPPMWAQDEFVDILVESYSNNIKHTFGGAAINGIMAIFDHYNSTSGDGYNTYQAWILYGDPSMMLRTKTPQAMTVSHEGVLPIGSPSYTVDVSNGNGALATITDADHNILGTAMVSNGTANVNLSGNFNPGDELTLCVFGYNKVTYLGTITVIALEGPYIALDSYTPATVHVGDYTDLSITFKNLGSSASMGTTTVTLTSNDPNVVVDHGSGSFGALAPEATTTVGGFQFHINPGVADGTDVTLHYTAINGSDTWEGNIVITAKEAVLTYQNMTWDGGFVPGDTFTVTAKFKNTGHYQATNAVATMNTTSGNYLTISNPTVTVGTIAVDQEVSCQFTVTVASNCPETAQIPVTFTMTADGGLTAQGNESLKNSCMLYFDLADSYGDGWNGASLTVSFDDGSDPQSLTVSSGYSASYTLEVGNGTHVTLTWSSGSYDGECSFTVSYEGDLVIFQQTTRPTAGVLYEFDCNCAAASQTFTVTVESENTDHGTVSGGGEYGFGESCTVTATPAEGYYFAGWLQDGEPVEGASATYTFIVTSDVNLVATFAEGLMIGDGGTATDQYLPSYTFYNYTLSQQIYTVDELGDAGLITSIAFYNGGTTKTRTYDVYMVGTTKSAFTGATDWVSVTSNDLVYSGSVTMEANEWTPLEFSTPFVYDGVSNVVLVVDDNTGSYSQGMLCRVFEAPSQALRIYSDGTNYNPFAPSSYSGTLMNVKNQLMVTKVALEGCVNAVPAGLEVSEVTGNTAMVSWTGYSESYNVMLGIPSTETLVDEDFAEGIPTDWDNGSDHPWTVVDGHMESGNAGVSSSTSSISVTVSFPSAGTVEFDAECMGEGTSTYWDHCDFYIDDTRELYIGAGVSGWNHYSFAVTSGEHTFTWSYTKDGSVNPTGDHFAVDNVVMTSFAITWNAPVAVEEAEYTFAGLSAETDYCVKVQGVCEGSETAWSDLVFFSTTEATDVTQTVSLSSGWNWFSTNVEISMEDLKSALVEALPGATHIVIKSQSDGQATYNGSTWRGQLNTLDVTQMYRIETQTEGEMTLMGTPINPAEHPITITNGANWIGFPLGEAKSLNDAFAGFAVSGDAVKSQNGLSTFNGTIWRGGFSTLEPGKGYIYKSSVQDDRTFIFETNR